MTCPESWLVWGMCGSSIYRKADSWLAISFPYFNVIPFPHSLGALISMNVCLWEFLYGFCCCLVLVPYNSAWDLICIHSCWMKNEWWADKWISNYWWLVIVWLWVCVQYFTAPWVLYQESDTDREKVPSVKIFCNEMLYRGPHPSSSSSIIIINISLCP